LIILLWGVSWVQLPESAGGVRSIYPQRPGRNDGNIYVGTTRNNILEGSLQRRFNQVVFGHGRQLWGLAVHPDDEVFATAGHDKNIALWRRHKLLWTTQVRFPYRFPRNEKDPMSHYLSVYLS
jgi:microtubule-associated protein-like 1/2